MSYKILNYDLTTGNHVVSQTAEALLASYADVFRDYLVLMNKLTVSIPHLVQNSEYRKMLIQALGAEIRNETAVKSVIDDLEFQIDAAFHMENNQ